MFQENETGLKAAFNSFLEPSWSLLAERKSAVPILSREES